MLDTAWRQLRYGWAVTTGREIRVSDVRRLIGDLLATRAEFGGSGQEQIGEMLGDPVDPEVRASMDARRWRKAVRQAYRTPYYRHALDALGLSPDELTLERAHELPPTPKFALRSSPEAFLSPDAKPVMRAWTTGTTGLPTTFWFSRYEVELAKSLAAVSMIMSGGLGPEDVLQICVSSRAVLGLQNTMDACQLIGAACFLNGITDVRETLRVLAEPVRLPGKKPRVSAISINPSYLGALMQEAQRSGYRPDDFGLDRIFCAGEILTASLRQRAERTFGAPITDNYAMTETFPLAGIVCEEGHLHLAADQGLVEVLRPGTLAPVSPGEVGMLVITPYPPYRETMPLLRLATGDLVRRLVDQPRCELAAMPATSPLLGKASLCPDVSERPLYQRDILDLLEAEPDLPLPCRYAVTPGAAGFDLHVLAGEADARLQHRLEACAASRSLPIERVVLHPDLTTMPPPEFARALLRETVAVRDERSGTWSLR
jgi:phenylacetate-CoA ligase